MSHPLESSYLPLLVHHRLSLPQRRVPPLPPLLLLGLGLLVLALPPLQGQQQLVCQGVKQLLAQ